MGALITLNPGASSTQSGGFLVLNRFQWGFSFIPKSLSSVKEYPEPTYTQRLWYMTYTCIIITNELSYWFRYMTLLYNIHRSLYGLTFWRSKCKHTVLVSTCTCTCTWLLLLLYLLCRRNERSLVSPLASQEGQQLHTWSGISFQHDAAACNDILNHNHCRDDVILTPTPK